LPQTIAFASTRSGNGTDIYTMNADGSDVRRVTDDGYSSDPAWSPDGARIAFVSTRDTTHAIYVMDASGANQRRISPADLDATQPAWSRSGRIAFEVDNAYGDTGPLGIWTVSPDGTGASHISGFGRHPQWSPDGSRITFTDAYHGDGRSQPAVGIMNADGSNLHDVGYGWGPTFSPDGRHLAWIAGNYPIDFDGQLLIANADGSSPAIVATRATGFDEGFTDAKLAWSPTSDALAYQTGLSSANEIYVIPASGGAPQRVTVNAGDDTDPDWRPVVPSTGIAIKSVAFRKGACATRPGTVVVTVIDDQARPLAGATVVVSGSRKASAAKTRADGTAAVVIPAFKHHRGRLALLVRSGLQGRPTVAKRISLPRC